MDMSQFDTSKWLRAGDLPAPSQIWTIKDVRVEKVGDDEKPVVYFNESQKGLGLNKINRETLILSYSKFSEHWLAKPVEVYQDRTQYQGALVDCIRLRIPPAAAPQQPVAQQAVPVAPAAPTQPQPAAPPQPPAAAPQAPWESDDQRNSQGGA